MSLPFNDDMHDKQNQRRAFFLSVVSHLLFQVFVQIDLEDADIEKWPQLSSLPFKDHIMLPGEMLYIPPRHWHFVKALDISFSVSFWWQ